MKTFDLMVIGSGSGLELSAEAAERGLSAAVVENGPFGGTCLNRGCIPSKMLIHCADIMETIRGAETFGIKASVQGVDWQAIIHRVFEEIDSDSNNIEAGNRNNPNITLYKGTGRFVEEKTLEVNGKRFSAEIVVIAAGTRPVVPDIPGVSDVRHFTSDDVMRLPEQPRRMAIVGGGYIAAEMGHFLSSMGTEVTLIHRGPYLLRDEDADVSHRFTEVYQRKHNIRLLLNARVNRIAGGGRVAGDGKDVSLDVSVNGEAVNVAADLLLFATGRVPNTDTLDVGKAGVEVGQRGFVKTDQFLRTTAPGVWALGDIVGKFLLKHSTNLEAAYVANNVFNPDHMVEVDYNAMPHAIFASPQVGSVGLTEREAIEGGVHYVAATYDYYDTAYGSSIEDRDGFAKVLADPESGEILGCHIIGTDAATLVQEAANAMRMRLTTDAITQSIYVHPALPEVVQRAFGALPV